MAEACRGSKPTLTFPWSTEDLIKAWQLTYGSSTTEAPLPDRQTICTKLQTDETLYNNLFKVKRRKDAELELRSQKGAAKAQILKVREEKTAKREAKKAEKEEKQAAKEQRRKSIDNNNMVPEKATPMNPFEEPDLIPFLPNIIEQAKLEVADVSQFWTYLYTKYADQMIPRFARGITVHDPASRFAPTPELPFSIQQLNTVGIENRATLSSDKHLQLLSLSQYNMILMDVIYNHPELLDMAVRTKTSPYIPWKASHINHFLKALTDTKDLTNQDDMGIRMALLRHWKTNPLLRQYISNLTPAHVADMGWVRLVPISTLLMTYATWEDALNKEFKEDQLQNLWANEVLLRTYELMRSSHGSGYTSYYDLLNNVVNNKSDYKLIQTHVGTFLVEHLKGYKRLNMHDIPFSEFKPPKPLKWNKDTIVRQATSLLNKAKAEQLSSSSSSDATTEESKEDAEINLQKGSTQAVKHLRKIIRGYFQRLETIIRAIDLFLTTLFLQSDNFRLHTSVFAGNLESLRALYIQANPENIRVSRSAVHEWAMGTKPKEATRAFHQDIRTSIYNTIPPLLADSSKRFQQFVNDTWSQFRLPPVTQEPNKSSCGDNAANEEVVSRDRKFLQPDNAQLFMNAEFNPGSFENGKIIVHSVGSGKTCLAIRIASDFARAGFRIVWVTKHALRNQVLKNHVSEICNLLIREHYDTIHVLEGKEAADAWLTKLPSQTNFQDVLKTLRGLGMDWTNLSYRQFSNALEKPEPLNELGRKWRKEAMMTSFEQKKVDPLRKTLVIIDEAHKLFTGELDRTELPNVPVIHQALQHSYNTSDQQRCRTLFLTATPTTDSMLPLISMLNMLHYEDAFPYNMATINPHITTDQGLVEHLEEVKRHNRQIEMQVACEMFPKGLQVCRNGEVKEEDDESGEPADAQAYFDAKSIISGNTFKPNELTNHLQEFWSRAFGLISYYDISADYSKFPRTEYARIILPSATMFQERLMASELLSSSKKDLSSQAKKIRQIAAWARFESVGNPSRQPDALDKVIIAENQRQTFFEPTLEDLELRRQEVLKAIEAEKSSEPDPLDQESLALNRHALQEVQAQIDAKTKELSALTSESEEGQIVSKRPREQGVITRAIRKLETHAAGLEAEVARFESNIQFHNSLKRVKIQYHEKRLKRIEQQMTKIEKREHRGHNNQGVSEFLNRVEDRPDLVLANQEEEEEEENIVQKPKRRGKKNTNTTDTDDEEDEDEEEYNIEEVQSEEKSEEKIKGEYYVKKSWTITKDKLPSDQPKNPKRHYFDQPDTFDKKQFREDIPLYSPKVDLFLRILQLDDEDCLKHNPEDHHNHRLRKRMVFCQDIHDIRAVAGALVATGWTFGMKRTWVKWKKEYFSTETNKHVGKTLTSTSPQLTWLPSTSEGEDYKRFLVLTRSRMGGPAGATLNDYAIQLIGAKGKEATYNHIDNLRGKDYRIILIDRNFVEGIDLPSTYADLYDVLLSKANRTQTVGRISRFCGNEGLPFVPNYGWPQRVYRYDLKFHTVGLHLSESQWERFTETVMDPQGPYSKIIPHKYLEGFLEKIEKNLFSPTELQILLDGNMELQRIRKKTLDVYEAMMEKVSIGALLYAPAMRNLSISRHELDDLLMEEEETAQEYRREIFVQDEKRKTRINYQLRSADQLKIRWQIHDSLLLSMLHHHVKTAVRNTAPELLSRWKDPEIVSTYFERFVKPDMQSAELVGTSEEHAKEVLMGMFVESVNVKQERFEAAKHKASKQQAKHKESEQKRQDKLVSHLIHLAKGKNKRLKQINPEELWEKIHQQQSKVTRETFDRVYKRLVEKPTVQKSKYSRKSRQHKKEDTSHQGSKKKRKSKSVLSAILSVKKAHSMDKRRVQTSTEQQELIIKETLESNPGMSREQVEGALKEWLTAKS